MSSAIINKISKRLSDAYRSELHIKAEHVAYQAQRIIIQKGANSVLEIYPALMYMINKKTIKIVDLHKFIRDDVYNNCTTIAYKVRCDLINSTTSAFDALSNLIRKNNE